jgi:hypothetical protein
MTPSLTLDATYRTDFSQVEVDQQQVACLDRSRARCGFRRGGITGRPHLARTCLQTI